jgi:hypothetical protein
VFFVVVIALTLFLFELGSFTAIALVTSRGWMAYIPAFSEKQMAFYLAERDRTLGWAFVTDSTWGSATDSHGRITRAIPRPDPAPFAAGAPCASTYGDSFVYGTEAEHDEAFPHFLAERLGCPVRNFGVPGFGSDQGLMLFRAQTEVDSAPVIIFQHLTENVLRNVNRYANLLYPGSPLRFKPRFVVTANGAIEYLAAPVQSRDDFVRLRTNPDSTLHPDGLLDRPRAGFPFTIALLRWLALDLKIRARITGVPSEAAFYDPAHPAAGFALSATTMQTAVRDAAADGRRAVILLQSTRQGLIHARDEGRWIDQALYDTLRARGVPVIHAGPLMLAAIGGGDPCVLFDDCTKTHMNARGNRIVAGIVADYLNGTGLIPERAASDSTRATAPRSR